MEKTTKPAKKRVSFYIDDSDMKTIQRVKKEKFYDKNYADMYREMLKIGAAQLAARK